MSASCAPLCFDRVALHRGPDIENAFLCSDVALRASGPAAAARGAGTLGTLFDDLRRAPELNLLPETRYIRGIERSSGTPMRVLFRGQLRVLEFCARHIFGADDFDVAPARHEGYSGYDVHVTDHPLLDRGLLRARPALRVHPWIRQRCRLGDDWRQTLAALPRSLRKELGRLLRRHAFTVSMSSDAALKGDFYKRLYCAYVRQRFGKAVLLPGEQAFGRESAGAALLTLHTDGQMTAGCLLHHVGDMLMIGKSALNLEHAISDRSELLDYFCLLLAQKLGCRWLDFGVSRPHLDDGVFRYKSKWRPQLLAAGGLKRTIRIRPLVPSKAALGLLSRNGFIERRRGRFVVRQLHPHGVAAALSDDLDAVATRAGLDSLVCATRTDSSNAAGPTGMYSRVQIVAMPPSDDPVRTFLDRS